MCPRAGDITNTIMLLCCTKTSSANPEKQDISVRLHHNLQWSSPRVNTGNTSSHPQKQRKKIPFHQDSHRTDCISHWLHTKSRHPTFKIFWSQYKEGLVCLHNKKCFLKRYKSSTLQTRHEVKYILVAFKDFGASKPTAGPKVYY